MIKEAVHQVIDSLILEPERRTGVRKTVKELEDFKSILCSADLETSEQKMSQKYMIEEIDNLIKEREE